VFTALTRPVPRSIERCELTHLARTPIDYGRAVAEHDAYERALEAMGCRIERLPPAHDLPDSVFVEDTAVVLDEVAVIARPGAESRRPETAAVAKALRTYRRLAVIDAPGTLDGGDVLRIGSRLFVGLTPRTNAEGVRQLALHAAPGLTVTPVAVTGCLHLKSAVTLAKNQPPTVLVNPAWVDVDVFSDYAIVEVDAAEPFAANVLALGEMTLVAAQCPLTAERLARAGIRVRTVPAGELAKAEGGLTCGSLIIATIG